MNQLHSEPTGLVQENLRVWSHYQMPVDDPEARQYLHMVQSLPPGKMLDLGCADGGLSNKFIHLGWVGFGMDISIENAISAHSKGIHTIQSLFQEPLPFENDCYDLVLAKQVIEHVVDTRFLLLEIYRVLKPGGKLLISTPNLASLSNRIRLLFGRYPGWMDYELGQGAGHVRYYTLSIFKEQLRSVGFRIEKIVGTELPVPILGRFMRRHPVKVLEWLGTRLPSLSVNLVIKACKG